MVKARLKKFLFALMAFVFIFSISTNVFATDISNGIVLNTTETENVVSEPITNDD